MSTVTSTYNQYASLENDGQFRVRSVMDRLRRSSQAEGGLEKPSENDLIAFSEQGRKLAEESARAREDLHSLDYNPLLQFEAEDGSVVTVAMALDPRGEEEATGQYVAARVTITRPDGTEESLYFSYDRIHGDDSSEETGGETVAATAESAEETGGTDGTGAPAVTVQGAEPSLMQLIEEYGLNKVGDAAESVFEAIRLRIEAMIAASEETAEETEQLEKVKSEREDRNSRAAGDGAVDTDDAEGSGAPASRPATGKAAKTIAGYARSGTETPSGAGTRFSRHY